MLTKQASISELISTEFPVDISFSCLCLTDLPIAFAIIAIDFAGFDAPQFSGFRARIDFYLLSAFDPQLQSFELQIYLLLSFEVQIYLLSSFKNQIYP